MQKNMLIYCYYIQRPKKKEHKHLFTSAHTHTNSAAYAILATMPQRNMWLCVREGIYIKHKHKVYTPYQRLEEQ